MNIIVDAHADLAWNMSSYGRDYTRSVADTRALEAGGLAVRENGDSLLGWPEYQRGRVAIVFSTLFASAIRFRASPHENQVYRNCDEAHLLYRDQLDTYRRMSETQPEKFSLVASISDLDRVLNHWESPTDSGHPVGMIVSMEGAEAIRHPSELQEWHELRAAGKVQACLSGVPFSATAAG